MEIKNKNGELILTVKYREMSTESIDLPGADLREANLQSADLSCFNLACANLTGADLVFARFFKCNLQDAKLQGSQLRGAHLAECNFTGADLTGADLTGATLRKVDFETAKLIRVKLDGAAYDKDTTFPKRFRPEDHNMILSTRKSRHERFWHKQQWPK